MIRQININLNAAHPELPLVEATTFTGAPSSVFIRGVPKAVGNWSITAVSVAVTFPDNTTTARAAVESAEGVWVATIPGTATSGRTVAGFRILADGIDENGAAVTGYVLGFADFAVLSFFPVPAPGETFFYLRYFDTMPTTAKKMDVTTIDGVLKYYNGTAWLPFTDLSNYYTKTETDGLLAPKVARTELFPAWAANTAYTTYSLVIHENAVYKCTTAHTSGAEWDSTKWGVATGADVLGVLLNYLALSNKPQINGNTLTGEGSQSGADLGLLDLAGGTMTGDLNVGDPDHLANIFARGNITVFGGLFAPSLGLQPDYGEYLDIVRVDSTWVIRITHGNTITLVSIPLSNGAMALLQNIAADFNSSDSYSKNALCIYNGTLYRCTNESGHTGDWDAADFAPATIEDVLAALRTGKQDALSQTQLNNIAAVPNKADASDLRYAISVSTPLTVTSGAAATTLDDRTHNVRTVAAPGSGNTTTITATLPPIVAGKSRDMFLNLTVGSAASDAGDISLSIVEPSGATVQIDVGSVEDIGVGENEIMIFERALPTTIGNTTTTHWQVTVRHEDFA